MASVIDFHSHFFSRPFFDALARVSPLPGEPEDRMRRVAWQAGMELPSADLEEHLGRWMAEMDRYGVRHLVSFASAPEEVPALAEVAAMAAGRLTPFALVDPCAPGAPERTRELVSERGFRGVVLFPAMHRYRLDGPEAQPLFAVLDELAAVAIVHCGMLRVPLRDAFGLPRSYDPSLANPIALVPVADAHPSVRFVIPHFGAGFFRETLMAGLQCENLFVDTSSSNGWMQTQPQRLGLVDVFERTLGVFGPERILFGTDSSTFPRGWRHDILTAQREALGACGASEIERHRIFSANAEELLGLDG
jgi:hypothetical protein